MAGCAAQVKRVTLELGGKSANLVFADADLEKAAATAPYAVFDNAGQDCCARSRILVQRPVYDRFLELLEPAVRALRVEDPACRDRRDGPADLRRPPGPGRRLPRRRDGRLHRLPPRRPRLLARPDGAARRLARPTGTGGRRSSARSSRCSRSTTRPTRSGSPTTPSTACPARSGPGTSGRALRLARAVEAGNLSVNSHSSVRYWTPFGGMKRSGLGRELGPDALHAFTDVKNVFISTEE